MNINDKADVIDNIIYGRTQSGDTCIDTAENYMEEVKEVDPILYKALVKLNDGADEMVNRLRELSKTYKLDYKLDDI